MLSLTKVAVVGSGKWGTNLARNFNELGALECICEVDEKRISELKRIYGNMQICRDIESVLTRSSIEGVVIATPPVCHYELAMKALEAGKHVFIEKPMTLHVWESQKLNETAKARKRILMVGHILLYHPAYVTLKKLVDDGVLGDLCYIHAQRVGLGRVRQEEDVVFSLAPHDISAMLFLFQEAPIALSCFGMNYLQKGIMDIAFLNLKFPGKKIGHINVSWLSPEKVRQHTVVGTKKMARIDEVSGKGMLTLYDSSVARENLAIHEGPAETVELAADEPLKMECSHFLSVLQSGKEPRSDGAQGLDVVRILNAARESSQRNGEWISL
jgi:UDP-2-acetamido-3-amino-2,3-dideoxy-glucuronate N-acetyltransferase